MKTLIIASGTGLLGFLIGLGVATKAYEDTGKATAMAGLGGLITAVATHFYYDGKLAQKECDTYEKLNSSKKQIEALQSGVTKVDNERRAATEKLKSLLEDSKKIEVALEEMKIQVTNKDELISKLQSSLLQLQVTLKSNGTKIQGLEEEVLKLQQECEDWDKGFNDGVERKANEKFLEFKRGELEKLYNDHDGLVNGCFEVMEELQNWAKKVKKRTNERREFVHHLADGFNQHIDAFARDKEEETQHYLKQIELLNLKIANLQHELSGEILVPVKSFGLGYYHTIGNRLIDTIFTEHQVVLQFLGLDEKDNFANIGLGFSKSADPEAIVSIIKNSAKDWSKVWGVYALENITISPLYPAITLTARRDQPVKVEVSAICRSQDEFKKLIKSSRIFYRIMGKPEAGKSPLTLILISWIIESGMKEFNTGKGRVLPQTLIEFCNPLKGKSKKTSGDFEVFYRWNDFNQAYQDLKTEYNFRGQACNENYKDNVGYVWVCDEFDNGIRKADGYSSTDLLSIFSDGGHLNVGAILLGQGVNVSKSKIQGEDIKMTTNIVLDAVSMRAFLDKYGDLFYDSTTIDTAKTTINELEIIQEEKNKFIVDTARKFRYCMVCLDRSPVFYQMPYFDQYDLEALNLEERQAAITNLKMSTNTQKSVISNILNEVENEVKNNNNLAQSSESLICPNPECLSERIGSKNKNYHRCLDCGKTWKKRSS